MIIDIHAHTYPKEIAPKIVHDMAMEVDMKSYSDGTLEGLLKSQKEAGIDLTVLMPISTKPSQTAKINEIARQINSQTDSLHVMSFAGIHPDNEDYKSILRDIVASGFKGIKLHPMFQGYLLNNIRNLRIVDEAVSLGLKVLIHGGGDINYPDINFADPIYAKELLTELGNPPGIVIAHMGGWGCWDRTIDQLSSFDIYLDTSSCLCPALTYEGKRTTGRFRTPLSKELFLDIVNTFGVERILYGSDTPWASPIDNLNILYEIGLSDEELRLITGENARKYLGL